MREPAPQQVTPTAVCTFDGCGRPVFRAGSCHGHYAQLRRGEQRTELAPRGRSPMQVVREAMAALYVVGDEPEASPDYVRANQRVEKAVQRHGLTSEEREREREAARLRMRRLRAHRRTAHEG